METDHESIPVKAKQEQIRMADGDYLLGIRNWFLMKLAICAIVLCRSVISGLIAGFQRISVQKSARHLMAFVLAVIHLVITVSPLVALAINPAPRMGQNSKQPHKILGYTYNIQLPICKQMPFSDLFMSGFGKFKPTPNRLAINLTTSYLRRETSG
jgi:hypothetical protein